MDIVDSTYALLARRLDAGYWRQGERLPSLAGLASLCGISRNDMSRVIARMRRESLAHGKRRGAIFAGPEEMPHLGAAAPGLIWQRLATHVGEDLLTGRLGSDSLAPATKLAAHYGTSVNTLKKALAQLTLDGRLIRTGRRYEPVRHSRSAHRDSIVMISEGDRSRGIVMADHRTEGLVKSFERDASAQGLRPICMGFDSGSARGLIDIKAGLDAIRPPAGYLVSLWGAWQEENHRRWSDLIRLLLARRLPVVAIDPVGNLAFSDDIVRNGRFRAIRIAGVRAGEMVGELLLRQGHRRIAYVTTYFAAEWARNRYDGLRRRIEECGGSVTLHARNEIIDTNDLTLAYLGMSEREVRGLFGERLTKDQTTALLRRLTVIGHDRLAQRIPVDHADPSIRELAHFLVGVANRNHAPAVYDEMLGFLVHLASTRAQRLYLEPFCREAIKTSEATAWVCSDDTAAEAAIAALERAGKRVPEDTAVIGFDNWKGAHEHQLSSYDFNMDGIMREALAMIREVKYLKSRPVIGEVDGYVVERRTTRG